MDLNGLTGYACEGVEWSGVHEIDGHERYENEPHQCHDPNGDSKCPVSIIMK